ncbi:hypothetical protein BJ742DRAFT_875152 [Cladochytrium replicatum]|nr:hypothetical protein BJ742DRAFT_875152 [Cladochytrium replicatum]
MTSLTLSLPLLNEYGSVAEQWSSHEDRPLSNKPLGWSENDAHAIVSRPGLISELGSEDLILEARVPVLKFKSVNGSHKIDISANNTSSPNQRACRGLHLRSRRLLILNMLVSVIQHLPSNALSSHPLARILLAFFETFGVKIDYHRRAIAVRLARHIDRPPEVYRMGYGSCASDLRLKIEDPTDTSNSVSKGTFRMEEIRKAIQVALRRWIGFWIGGGIRCATSGTRSWRGLNVDEWKMMVRDPGYEDPRGYEFEEVRGRSMSTGWNGEAHATALSPATTAEYECTPTPVEVDVNGETSRGKKKREREGSIRTWRKGHKKRRRKDRSERLREWSAELERGDDKNDDDDERKLSGRNHLPMAYLARMNLLRQTMQTRTRNLDVADRSLETGARELGAPVFGRGHIDTDRARTRDQGHGQEGKADQRTNETSAVCRLREVEGTMAGYYWGDRRKEEDLRQVGGEGVWACRRFYVHTTNLCLNNHLLPSQSQITHFYQHTNIPIAHHPTPIVSPCLCYYQ